MSVHPELLNKSPEQLREMARECRVRSAESFERSDTDGFLSQWASDSTARLYDYAASLAEDGWYAEETALFDLDGNLVSTELKDTPYGVAWLVHLKNSTASGVLWVNPSRARKAATRRANLEKKGYRLGRIRRRVVPVMASGGAWQVYPSDIPDRDHPEIEIISTDDPGEDR